MVKKTTTLTIDSEIIDKAKSLGMNLSAVAERAIKERSGVKEVEINTEVKSCEFCNRGEMEKATRNNLNGLTWLFPDERWICPTCLKNRSMKSDKELTENYNLFMEAKKFWDVNKKEIMNDPKNAHLRRTKRY